MKKMVLIENLRYELDRIAIKEKRLNECKEYLRTLILPREVEIKINNIIVQALEELKFYENEIKQDLGVMVYNG